MLIQAARCCLPPAASDARRWQLWGWGPTAFRGGGAPRNKLIMLIESLELPHCQTARPRDLMLHRRQVLAQQIAAEVAVEVAPHRVDVVAVVLRVVELDDERRALH